MYLLGGVMYLSIIAAQQKRRPGFYVPYLVFEVGNTFKKVYIIKLIFSQGIGIVLATLVFFVFTAFVIAAPESMIDEINKKHPEYKMTVESM